jgi:signal transduction histidine kinase
MKSIKTKFILFALVLIVPSLVIPVYFLITQFRENFNQRSVIMLEATLDLLNYTIDNAMMQGEQKNIQELVNNLGERKGIDHVRIITPDGIVKFASSQKDIGTLVQNIHNNLNHDSLSSGRITLLNDNEYHAFAPILNDDRCRGCHTQKGAIAYLDVGASLTSAETKFYTGTRHMIFLGISILLIITAGFYFIFHSFINKPLQRLISAMREVKNGKLTTHLAVERDDEFGTVNRNFNMMVDRLHDSQEEINNLHFEQLQHADRLITLGELTSETAHEINNHTAIIMSRADYLSLEVNQSNDISNYADDINVILSQTEKISEITRNVLQHSKKTEKNFEDVNLAEVIESTVATLEPILRKRKINLSRSITQNQAVIRGDLLQLEQALTNLILNSLDAMENEGSLQISLSSENSSYALTVSDNGSGIDDSIKDQVFSPFFTTKSGGRGSGLGLYIVKNICKNHDADITMISKKDRGTQFKILFNGKN